jgi:hypothetical protein
MSTTYKDQKDGYWPQMQENHVWRGDETDGELLRGV